jgi:plasmid stabilization system protein ParE
MDPRTTVRSVQRTVVDGVPALWAELPTDPTTTLAFGVGYRDCGPATAGITHLVEHLVMRRVGRVRYTVNAESSLSSTAFYVVGTPEQTADFLRRVCDAVRGLADAPDAELEAELEAERRTVLTEIGTEGLYVQPDPLSHRYGPAGPGAAAVAHARLLDWRAAEVRAAVAQWFHAGNAVLTSTRPLPEGLRLPLPPARAVERAPDPAPVMTGRASTYHPAGLNLSGVVAAGHDPAAAQLALGVLVDALTEATRTASGDVYAVQGSTVTTGRGDVLLVDLDPEPDRVAGVLRTALAVLDRLAGAGPATDELEHTREVLANELALGAAQAQLLDAVAVHGLRGVALPDAAGLRAALPAATAEQVRAVLADLAASLLVSLPDEAPLTPELETVLGGAGLRNLPHGSRRVTGPGRTYRGRFFGPGRGLVVTLHEDAVVLGKAPRTEVVRAEDVVLAGTDSDGDVELVTTAGCAYLVPAGLFRGLARPLAAWLSRLPEPARYAKTRPGDRAVPAADG